jgi:tetratricopeptide (TPR) repeat protein
MELSERINRLWSLTRARSVQDRRKRQRLGAGFALTCLMGGLLAAVGLAVVVVAFAAVVLLVVGAIAAMHAVPRYWPQVRSRGRRIAAAASRACHIALAKARSAQAHIRKLASSTSAEARTWLRTVRRRAPAVVAQLRRRGSRLAKIYAALASRAARYVATIGIDPHREALRLNEAGTRERRNGAHSQAAELHRRALEILQAVDDRRAVALTQNNLALALSHVGDDGKAIALFEEAASTLRELGDVEHEGQVMANLGLAHRRHGRHEQSETMLELALTKLRPASRAYEAVDAELSRTG